MPMFLVTVISASCFFLEYRAESSNTIDYFKQHTEIQSELRRHLNEEDSEIAQVIVMPEFSVFSKTCDALEYRTMCLFYILYGTTDFSIGHYQMKPSFIETLETYISKDKNLKKKYHKLIIKEKNIKKCRKMRMDRMLSLHWQTIYLAAFIDICKNKTSNISLNSVKEKIRYWATLYNSGLELSEAQVYAKQKQKFFPRFYKEYNYSDVAWDFYLHLKQIKH